MTVKDILNLGGFELLTKEADIEKNVSSLRNCDLLSFVMAKGKEEEAWITVQIHSNIIAVASLLDMSCIILPESIEPDADTLVKADENDIPVLSTALDGYSIFKLLYDNGLR